MYVTTTELIFVSLCHGPYRRIQADRKLLENSRSVCFNVNIYVRVATLFTFLQIS